MKIVALVKHVPDATAERTFDDADHTTDRTGVDGLLSELDEYAIESALTVADGGDAEVVALTMGPSGAADAIKKALQMGADSGVHISDDALHGSDAPATARVLAAALRRIGDVDLVLTGMASTDGGMSVVPAMLAEHLDLAHVGFVGEFSVDDGTVRCRRDGDTASESVEAALPAIVSVTDQINEPRYPSFKGIMAAKKKPVETLSLADLDIDPSTVGLAAATSVVDEVTKRPERTQGEIVTDEGDGGTRLVEYLAAQKFV
ncbi:electron transfer flavoprotein beta subunit [Haloactinopolyspora alba]|uniref:Electron transfer flavoprotein subunit beta n=1 Tax=Haloactinopolyspora alba TaxID=648780 RepID=A0A2P8E9D9_9ACTN|nr:electron transfer flavoprotein subunit beta/FixA family protein [Haloactinopolyspora alba]PSL06103.1 electron transfer flavoprotein beta subunit [Haloactinopolyspora alba]